MKRMKTYRIRDWSNDTEDSLKVGITYEGISTFLYRRVARFFVWGPVRGARAIP